MKPLKLNRKVPLSLVLALLLVFLVSSVSARNKTAAVDIEAKIQAGLMSDIKASGANEMVQFVARINAGADLSAYTDQWFARPFTDPLGSTVASGFAQPAALLQMATDPEVISLRRAESLAVAPQVEDPDLESVLNVGIASQLFGGEVQKAGKGASRTDEVAPGPAPEGWYHTTGAIHGSQEAWAKGYTGEGVRYMSNDSGADYCHPDLEGTWAYIEDEGSPYYGLPEMFDSWSSYMAAFDYYLGTSYIADGLADYADTSVVCNLDDLALSAVLTADNVISPTLGMARVRVAHASPDAPAVDIYVDGGLAIPGVAYKDVTDYAEMPTGDYLVQVVPAGGDPADHVLSATLTLSDTDYTVAAVGLLADIEPLVLEDDNTDPDPGNAHVRFVHASPNAPAVDITLADGTVLIADVAFKEASDYLPVAADTYDLEVRLAGTGIVALELPGVILEDGTVYTAFAMGLAGVKCQFEPLEGSAHIYNLPGTSLSGDYHIGSHVDKALAGVADILSASFGDGTAVEDERAAILVVDENAAGEYDTVYVDLDYDFDFADETPARLTRDFTDQEGACLDYDLDGLNDVSGGLVYFISDGETAVPTLDWFWGIPGSRFSNGDLVAFHVQDYYEGGGSHGQGTTSVAVGQGVVTGSVYWGGGGSPINGGQGLVIGPGKDVASTQNGNYYVTPFIEDAYIYAGLGYDGTPGTWDDIQIVSNSWGFSGTDNDGFDHDSRLIDSINRALAPNTALLFSTGNGAAGYGTVAPPSPASGIGVGASTLYGSVGVFESIASSDQIVGGDVMSWSNRGPGVRNVAGVDVVATGAFGTGDVPLNQVLWGAIATADFGGTSMAAPVAAGNLALMYQAWYERTGEWPTFDEARDLLMGTAKNTDHDVWTQGAGLVDADVGTDVAGGIEGVFASPSEWSVGDYRAEEYAAFAHIIGPGETDAQIFTLHNTGDRPIRVELDSLTFKLINTRDYSFTSMDQSLDHGSFTTPDYAIRIDQDIFQATDLLMVRVTKPYDQFDPNGDLAPPYSNWRVHLQDWTDLDGDGLFWADANGNGKVDIGEMDENEYIRFTYGYDAGPSQQARISNPLERMHDGILLTLRHRDRTPQVPTTDLTIEASHWQWTNWSWLHTDKKKVTVPAGGSATFEAQLRVPERTPYGMYQGAIMAEYSGNQVVIPVTVAVAAEGTSFIFGQTNFANGRYPLYDNENMFGYTDYTWRAESGDWRFFWTDVDGEALPESGESFLVVDNSWDKAGTDIDTIILGPTEDGYSPSSTYGPYTLEEIGRSAYLYIGSGRWLPQTSTGGPRELVSAPVTDGLHAILFHQVKVDGSELDDAFGGKVGLVNLDPGAIMGTGSGSANVTISSELEMSDFVAEGFGLGGPVTTVETIFQDDPDDPTTASFTTTVLIDHGAKLEVSTANSANGSDLDLFVYDPDGNLVGSSTTPTDEESVAILFPEDGTYTVAVHGWSVPAGSDTFELTINAVQGYDVQVTSLPEVIPAGGSGMVTVEWDASDLAPGTYYGLVLMGPAAAPGLFQVPVEVTVP